MRTRAAAGARVITFMLVIRDCDVEASNVNVGAKAKAEVVADILAAIKERRG